jgi:hypothetical protein
MVPVDASTDNFPNCGIELLLVEAVTMLPPAFDVGSGS